MEPRARCSPYARSIPTWEDTPASVIEANGDLMFFPDPGLAEMYRVTAPGGRGVVIVFGPPERVPMSLFGVALARALPDVVPPPDPILVTEPLHLKP